MGFAYSWLAIREHDRRMILPELNLQETGRQNSYPIWPLAGIQLDPAWYIIASKDYDFFRNFNLLELSMDSTLAVFCSVEEHVMVSTAACWSMGYEVWRVHHDSQKEAGFHHLETSGVLPPFYQQVCEEFVAQQMICNDEQQLIDCILEVPLEVARQMTGFAIYEESSPGNSRTFVELKPIRSPKWWQFWL